MEAYIFAATNKLKATKSIVKTMTSLFGTVNVFDLWISWNMLTVKLLMSLW